MPVSLKIWGPAISWGINAITAQICFSDTAGMFISDASALY